VVLRSLIFDPLLGVFLVFGFSVHGPPRAFSVAGPQSLWNSLGQLERSGSRQGQLQTSAEDIGAESGGTGGHVPPNNMIGGDNIANVPPPICS